MSNPGDQEYEGDPFEYGGTEEDHAQVPVPEWDEYEPGAEAPPRRGRPRNYAALETSAETRSKMLHDKPPTWDGEHAEKLLKPYLESYP